MSLMDWHNQLAEENVLNWLINSSNVINKMGLFGQFLNAKKNTKLWLNALIMSLKLKWINLEEI